MSVMPFGKRRGKPIASLPRAYIERVLFFHRLPSWLAVHLLGELQKGNRK